MSIWFYIITILLAIVIFWKDIKKAISKLFKKQKLVLISGNGTNPYEKVQDNIRSVLGIKNTDRVQEYLYKKHISVMEIGHIWKSGDDFDRITLLNRLYEEYKDYNMIINLIDKKPSMLDYPEIKKMYEHITRLEARLEDMKKDEEIIKGWRS
jgi:hypothetical protein